MYLSTVNVSVNFLFKSQVHSDFMIYRCSDIFSNCKQTEFLESHLILSRDSVEVPDCRVFTLL